MENIERRTFKIEEIREGGDSGGQIRGYAAVFNALSEDLGGFRERIQPGAFSQTIMDADVRALWNHNPDYPLGRTKAGTLTLSEDANGLRFQIDPPDTQYARDLLVSMRRGDVDQMSFGFQTVKDRWEKENGQVVRTLMEVKLFDVSPVTYPAYPQTSASVRSALEEFVHTAQEQEQPVVIKPVDAQARATQRKRKNSILKSL